MYIEKFITDMLNLDPNSLESIESVSSSTGSVSLRIKLKKSFERKCPYCGGPLVSIGFYEKKLIHSTFVNRPCTIYFSRRKYICRKCECTFSELNPFAGKGKNVTYEAKINVLKDLKRPSFNYTITARRNNVSPTKVLQIFDRHVSVPRKPLPEVLSIDEHYFPASDFDSLYICVLTWRPVPDDGHLRNAVKNRCSLQ